jgi:NAD(P)-dependent dehydrogenase (short-subunit alcohol dehydrogenase family)
MNRLDGKVAIVTGGAQGIGARYAEALAHEGANVLIADVLDTNSAVDGIKSKGGAALGVTADVTNADSVADMIGAATREWGGVDILVNNAAIFASLPMQPFMQIADDDWDKVMSVNVGGLFKCAKAVVPEMQNRGGGKIINISSGTVMEGAAMLLHYVTSKSAVIGFTRSLARELGELNICVNALAPGFTLSEGVKDNESYAPFVRDAINSQRCLKRDQQPEDLTGALLFLATSDSDFMTGQTVLVDGGMYTH